MSKRWLVGGLLVALAVAVVSPLASPHPDGLERVAEDEGFISRAQESRFEIIPDYVLPGVANEALATIVAGVVGAAAVGAVALTVARLRRDQPA